MAAFDNRVFFQISRLDRRMTNHLRGRLADAGLPITMAQSGVLFILVQKDGQKLGELAGALGLDNSALTRMADRLERSGLVERRAGEKDRRARLLHITAKGKSVAKEAGAVIGQANSEMIDGFSSQELETFIKVMDRLGARCAVGVTAGKAD